MPVQLRRYKRYLPAEEARQLIRERIRAGLPVTAGDIRALGYSLENARWSAYRREVDLELGIPHRRPRRGPSTSQVPVGCLTSECHRPMPISVIPPVELTQTAALPVQMPLHISGHIGHRPLAAAQQLLSALTRHSIGAIYSLFSQASRALGLLRATGGGK